MLLKGILDGSTLFVGNNEVLNETIEEIKMTHSDITVLRPKEMAEALTELENLSKRYETCQHFSSTETVLVLDMDEEVIEAIDMEEFERNIQNKWKYNVRRFLLHGKFTGVVVVLNLPKYSKEIDWIVYDTKYHFVTKDALKVVLRKYEKYFKEI